MTPARQSFREIYQRLAQHGLWGFPIAADGSKAPLVKWGEFQLRPPAPELVALWRRQFRHAGAAIPTGGGTGLMVIDADSPEAVEYLKLRTMPETVMVKTRRGMHYYLRYPVGLTVRNSTSLLASKMDIRGSRRNGSRSRYV